MKRKYVDTDSNEAEADVSEASRDQKKFDNRLDQMEAMIRGKFADIDGSIQKVQASLVEIHENIGMLVAEEKERLNIKLNIKQGVVHAIFNIDDVPNVGGGSISSKTTYCSGANWWLVVCKTKEGPSLGAYLHHTADLLNVYHGTNKNYTIRLLGSSGNKEKKFKNRFANNGVGEGPHSFIPWSELVNFTNGFVDEKGNFKMEVEFSVTANTPTSAPLDSQFLTCGLVESDCTLLVEGRRFAVNKGLLASYSSYFKTLFFGEFREKDQDEIELKEVFAEEFLHLLKVIYPPFDDADVTPNNVEILRCLADRYQVKAVLHRCSQYTEKCAISKFSLGEKLVYAQNYHLLELLEHCINECKTVDDMNKLRATSHYSELQDSIKLRIYEKIRYP